MGMLALGACRGDDTSGDDGVDVDGVWSPATPAAADVGAVYLTVRSGSDDRLIGVSVAPDVAARAMIHRTIDEDGMVSMEPVAALELAAGEDVTLEPGATHIMLTQLAAPLEIDTSFRLTLDLERGADVTTDVDVVDPASAPSADVAQEPVAGPISRIHSMSDSISASSSPLTGIATS